MDTSLIKEYVELDRKRMCPKPEDCTDKRQLEQFLSDLKELGENEENNARCLRELCSHRFTHIFDYGYIMVSIAVFMIFIGMVLAGIVIDGQTLSAAVVLGFFIAGIWVLWFFADTKLSVNIIVTITWVVCTYMMVFRRTILWGSHENWLWIFAIVGVVAFGYARICHYKEEVLPNLNDRNKIVKQLVKFDNMIQSMEESFLSLGDVAAVKQKKFLEQHPELSWKIQPRTPWFTFKRALSEGESGLQDLPFGEFCSTNFCHFDVESKRTKHNHYTVHYDECGYETVSVEEARRLIAIDKVRPLYELGFPEITDDMEFRIFRHRWWIENFGYVMKSMDGPNEHLVERFDRRMDIEEMWELGLGGADGYIPENGAQQIALDRYKKEKEKARERLHEYAINNPTTSTYRDYYERDLSGDEIAFLEVSLPEHGLYGYYAGNSIPAVKFTLSHVHGGYELSPLTTPNSDAQAWLLYHSFVRKK